MVSEVQQFNKWLRRRSPQSTTPLHYSNDLHLCFAWADKPPDQITVRDVDAYVAHEQELGHTAATVNRRLAALRSFYVFLALMDEDAPANPVIPKRHFVRQGRQLPRDVEDQVLDRFFAQIDSARDRCIFLLMLRCGLRVAEVHHLSLGDLYLQPGGTSLPRLWVRGKGDTRRIVYLSAQSLSALQAWLKVRPVVTDQAVFLNRFGRRLSISGIQKRLAHYRRLAGLRLSCHQLRHTFGRHLVEAGVPVTTIQRLLGHARLRTSQMYMHLSDQQVQADYRAAMDSLSHRLPGLGGEQ
jgi:site-specific recombinase XerC